MNSNFSAFGLLTLLTFLGAPLAQAREIHCFVERDADTVHEIQELVINVGRSPDESVATVSRSSSAGRLIDKFKYVSGNGNSLNWNEDIITSKPGELDQSDSVTLIRGARPGSKSPAWFLQRREEFVWPTHCDGISNRNECVMARPKLTKIEISCTDTNDLIPASKPLTREERRARDPYDYIN